MSITKTEAIVLKGLKFGDTSKIVTLYTKDYGKIKVMAKGIRKPQSRLAGTLETFFHIHIVFYKKLTTEIYLLSQSEIIRPFLKIPKGFSRYAFASGALELLDKLITGEEPNPEIFDLTLKTLSFMESCSTKSLEKSFLFFAFRLADFLGYKPKFDRCISCGKAVSEKLILFSPEKGGIICQRCARQDQTYLRLSKDSTRSALKLQSIKLDKLNSYNIPKEQLREISSVVLNLLDYHTGRGKDLKSLEFLKTTMSNDSSR
ncbi:MAG: DNA repair protein RecO [Candidatus Zixiibacteriota bacterium]